MPTREIPPESWIEFLDGFSRRHRGWLVRVEILGGLGAQVQAEELPLEGISADHGNKDIAIALALPDRIVEHFVTHPQALRVEEENGAETAIEIEAAGGERTIVKFRAAATPEMVDGILPERAETG